MLDSMSLEGMNAKERAMMLVEHYSSAKSITIDMVRFVQDDPDKSQAIEVSKWLINNAGLRLSNNAKAFLLRSANLYKSRYPEAPSYPYARSD